MQLLSHSAISGGRGGDRRMRRGVAVLQLEVLDVLIVLFPFQFNIGCVLIG